MNADAGVNGSLLFTVTVPLSLTVTLKAFGRGEEFPVRTLARTSGNQAMMASLAGWREGDVRRVKNLLSLAGMGGGAGGERAACLAIFWAEVGLRAPGFLRRALAAEATLAYVLAGPDGPASGIGGKADRGAYFPSQYIWASQLSGKPLRKPWGCLPMLWWQCCRRELGRRGRGRSRNRLPFLWRHLA